MSSRGGPAAEEGSATVLTTIPDLRPFLRRPTERNLTMSRAILDPIESPKDQASTWRR